MKAYLAGPMAGYPEQNWPLFKRVTSYLRERKYDICCPTECAVDITLGWLVCLKADLKGMLDCETIYLLPGWNKSRGATFELLIATILEYKIWRVGIEGEDITLWSYDFSKLDALKTFIAAHFPDRYLH